MNRFTGTWAIVESPDFDDDYMAMEIEQPYVKLSQRGKQISGEYYVGLQEGEIDGRLRGNLVIFSFEGRDEMDGVHGCGTAEMKEDQLIFTLMYHDGDDYTFECERQG